ncbi:MAG: rod shape-determining protein MreC, partial [Candidatus Cloacimonadota bacterium]|nr:rod shape-determining protein MreC [Candidatus Cloacimonadota bacterium]
MQKANNILFIVLLIISIVFISGNNQDRINKAQFVGRYFFLPYTSSISYISSLANLTKKNAELAEKLFSAQMQNRLMSEKILKFNRISSLLDSASENNLQIRISHVVGTGSFINFETLSIDGDVSENVKKNSPVISANGLIGRITTVYPSFSVVQTFRNRYFRMGAIDERSRVNGIVETELDGRIYFRKIKVGSNIKIGDKIITSSLSSIYPPGIPLGEIIKISETKNSLFMEAEI